MISKYTTRKGFMGSCFAEDDLVLMLQFSVLYQKYLTRYSKESLLLPLLDSSIAKLRNLDMTCNGELGLTPDDLVAVLQSIWYIRGVTEVEHISNLEATLREFLHDLL